MKIFIDTFSWAKIDLLISESLFDFDPIYDTFEVCITHFVSEELNHRGLSSCISSKLSILPVKNKRIYEDAISQGFDKADASILSYGTKNDDVAIVTEDRPLLLLGMSYKFAIMQLIDFCRLLNAMELITKRELYRINQKLRILENITKKKEKEIKLYLQR
ncbi:MAG: hypothetical protein K9W44_13505 [Candidatus Lokiarchaeota archaeon]|nr:hypothetical protein [Candidatus Harpocratesius repetitus]